MSRNKFIQDVIWVLILVLYPNLLNVSIQIKKITDEYGKIKKEIDEKEYKNQKA